MKDGCIEDWLTQDKLDQITAWAEKLTKADIAHNMGIHASTFRRWRRENELLRSAYEKGASIVDERMESALIKKAEGFEYDEVTKEYDSEGNLKYKKVVKKRFPPDVPALKFYTMNRMPDKWSEVNRQEINVIGEMAIEDSKELVEKRAEELRLLNKENEDG